MSFCLFILLLLSASLVSCSLPNIISVTEDYELEQLLCGSTQWKLQKSDAILVLSTSVTHTISSNVSFCDIATTYSLTLRTDSQLLLATVHCDSSTTQATTGFVFTNASSLTMQRLILNGCGAFLADFSHIRSVNSSSFYFTQYQSVVLLFLSIESLLIQNVTFSSCYGFGVIAINPTNATLSNVSIKASKNFLIANKSGIGSGILIIFADERITSIPHNVFITHAVITGNVDYEKDVKPLFHLINMIVEKVPVINAAGVTLLYTQTQFTAKVVIDESFFESNIGPYTGGVLALHYKSSLSQTVLNNTRFIIADNDYQRHGSSLLLVVLRVSNTCLPLIVENSSFKNQAIPALKFGSGAVFIGVYRPNATGSVRIIFKNIQFVQNYISTTGSCLYARTYYYSRHQFQALSILFEGVTAFNNSQANVFSPNAKAGMFTLFNAGEVSFSGFNDFHDNFGSVFEVTNTRINLNGTLVFCRNRGKNGPAFKLLGNSHLHLADGLNATFIDNLALMKGGAIFAYDLLSDECIFKTDSKNFSNIHITFINNTAYQSGSSIFASNVYSCIAFGKTRSTNQSLSLYNKIFKFNSISLLNNISTPSSYLSFCYKMAYTKPVYPGQTLVLHLSAREKYVHKVQYSVVSFVMGQTINNGFTMVPLPSWQVFSNDVSQVLTEGNNCTMVQVTLLKRVESPELFINSTPILIMSTLHDASFSYVKLNFTDCPMGFKLDINQGKCVCSLLLLYLSSTSDCKVSSPYPVIAKSNIAWLGLMKLPSGTVVVGASVTCSLHCNYEKSSDIFVVKGEEVETAYFNNPNSSTRLCPDNREGPLCSICSPGFSVVFGSNECKRCSNWWMLSLILYMVTGPLLIFLLYALRLTLTTGTLNGIIFCSQVLQVFDFSPLKLSYLNMFIKSSLTLELNYPTCFYNGMTELCRSGLMLLYPVYLISILIGLIICSRYSVRLSNKISHTSVQVLVTVVHLCFSKLLLLALDVFTSIDIYYHTTNTARVQCVYMWFRDATVEFGKGNHLVLIIVTLLIVCPILGVYMTVLLAGRPLMRINRLREYLRPVYEAIHAPYKHNKEFFFGARLLIVILLYMLYVLYSGRDEYLGIAIGSSLLAVYSALEGLCRPFKQMSLNIFNFALLSITALVYCTCWYFLKISYKVGIIVTYGITNSVIRISFIGVIILHFLWVRGLLDKIMIKSWRLWHRLPWHQRRNQDEVPHVHLSGSFFEPYDRVREPLLSSQSQRYT